MQITINPFRNHTVIKKGIYTTLMKAALTTKRQTERLPPSPAQARFAFLILLIINILNYTDRSILSAVQPLIQIEFHLTDTQLGLLNSSFLFIYGITTLPLGIWADRGIRKDIVAICVGIWSIATTLGGLTHSFIHLFLTRSVLGVGEAGYAPASISLIGDYFPKERRGRILSIWSIGNLIGTALGLIVGGIVAQAFGWRWVFFIVGIPGLLTAFLIWRTVEPRRGAFDHVTEQEQQTDSDENESEKAEEKHPGFFITAHSIIKTPTYWVLVAAFICSFFIIGAALAWMPTYLHRDFALSIAQAGTLSGGVLAGGSLIGTLLGGWLADKLQQRMPQGRMIIATLAFLIGAPLTWLALSLRTLPLFIAIFVLAIICLSFCLGPIQAVLQDITIPAIRSTAVGLALLLGHLLGDASSPIIIGAISQKTSLEFALLVTAPTCLLLAGLICLIGIKTVASDMQRMQAQLQQ
jgi:sugar phosphate permease